MKIGVSGFAWATHFGEKQFDVLPQVRRRGLTGFEVSMFEPAQIAAAEIRRAMEANDLECSVCAILPVGINPISPDGAVRRRSQEHLLRCIETTAELGAKMLGGPVYAPIGYLPEHRVSGDEWGWAVEMFQALGDALDAHDVTLCVEPVNRSETFFMRTAAEAKRFCEAVGHARVGVTMDTFHANIEEKSIAAAVRLLGGDLKHVHASENDRGVPGAGHVDFAGMVEALREVGYDGYLMIEGFGYAGDAVESPGRLWAEMGVTPEDVAFGGADYLRGLLG